jgi:hypothetical protein
LVLQHPNFSNFTQAFSFNYKALSPYASFRSTLLSSWSSIVLPFLHSGHVCKLFMVRQMQNSYGSMPL